ncbi:xanthine dehydrogenase family protein molybdopterin-binding subunit [Pacificimonas sp. WHA3]|uniref:Xanthine dehydrogenase family protein molybdopterin-binding subunit n=1 Tax=Pacificimonas pallii TaxID=2827236 RepID=A0ABS6SHY1_9SPHN|nr:xanthine dehydrogenase family protein molybdopterin-binding subunit [Pacificimonas pallii]MBV7257658.1 xanthine dehydrogenase family protein molybdopterin-binding subunit [Pacificimonas pallii]
MKFGVGQSPKRLEDERLITGAGRFTDDYQPDGCTFGVTVRSPYAHARILGIDVSEARAMPGVLAVYTADDIADYGRIPCLVPLSGPVKAERPLLTGDKVRFVGDGVAFVVAETREQARFAAEAVNVDYEEIEAVHSIDRALENDAARVWEEAESNKLFDWQVGDSQAADEAFANAAHVTTLRLVQNRVAPTSMEVRSAVGQWDAAGADGKGAFLFHTGSQGVANMRPHLAKTIMKVEPEQMRIVTGDVGGGFGMKSFCYPEYGLVLHAARALGRPVKWTGERGDAFQTDLHGRAMVTDAQLALDDKGMILGLKAETWSDLGGYQSQYGPAIQTFAGGRIIGGVYRIPAIHNVVHGVATNTAPTDAYRGAGRPEAAYIIERLMEAAARETGMDVIDIRRRNLLRPDELPHENGLGLNFDVGNYPALLNAAVKRADWAGFDVRRAEAEARGMRYGRGAAFYVEIAGGGSTEEFADVKIRGGKVHAAIGTQSNGQGHETAYAQVIAEKLGIDLEDVIIEQGDTDRLDVGNGTGGSRSMVWGGAAGLEAAADVIAKGRIFAAQDLGGEVDFDAGVYRARGTNETRGLMEIAAAHPGELDVRASYKPENPGPTYPNGCHIAEVELNPDTGILSVSKYTVVDDFGTLVNPMLVEGQVQGGVAQGLGQAVMEDVVYDENGQLLTGSFMDYGIPRADDMPLGMTFDTEPVPNPNNPLGAKGCGEAGTIGAMPSIMNALVDCLGGQHVDMPATPEKLWRLAQGLEMRQAAA